MSEFARYGLFGRSQSGKSTMMDRLLRGHERTVLFDALPAREDSARREGYTKIEHMAELRAAIADTYKDGFRYWFKPENDEKIMQHSLSDLSYLMINWQNQLGDKFGFKNVPEMALAVDEMSDCFPNHSLKQEYDGFAKMCRSGRHSNIHLIGATQRPAEVSTRFRGQLNRRYIFNLTEPADLRHIEEIGGARGRELADVVANLAPLEYVKMDGTRFQFGKLSF